MDQPQIIEISDDSDTESLPISVRSQSFLLADTESNRAVCDNDSSISPGFGPEDGFVSAAASQSAHEHHERRLSAQGCLAQVVEIFPDISHDHVLQLYRESVSAGELTFDFCEILVRKILDGGAYPKEKDKQDLKRKRANSDNEEEMIAQLHTKAITPLGYFDSAREILGAEFPYVPIGHIARLLLRVTRFYPAYIELETAERTFDAANPPYVRLKTGRKCKKVPIGQLAKRHNEVLDLQRHGYDLSKELEAARQARAKEDAIRKAAADQAREEAMNEQQARDTGNMLNCACCFTEFPINRMTHCNGDESHFFCLDCARRNVEVDIGQSRCRPKCMDVSGCSAGFDRAQFITFLDSKTFETLERMQQQEDIRLAGLDDLEDCPFCDFKAIYPPVEEDREFRCRNPECAKVSCRLCNRETHIPQSCEEFAKENRLTVRHAVEEAMTQALVRSCNKCKAPFIKEYGCNKMACTKCGSKQCYVCSKTVTDYQHFDSVQHGGRPGGCPLYDNTEQRHDEDVKKAEAAAVAQLQKEHPTISVDDLKIKVSDEVQRAEKQRVEDGRPGNVGVADLQVRIRDQERIFEAQRAHLRHMLQRGRHQPPGANVAAPPQLNVILNQPYPVHQPVAPLAYVAPPQLMEMPVVQPLPVVPPFQPPIIPPGRPRPLFGPFGHDLGPVMHPGVWPPQIPNAQHPPAAQPADAQAHPWQPPEPDDAIRNVIQRRFERMTRGVDRDLQAIRQERQRIQAMLDQQAAGRGLIGHGFGQDGAQDDGGGWAGNLAENRDHALQRNIWRRLRRQ